MHATEPLWLAAAEPTPYRALEDDLEVDVAVIGAGLAGVTTALLLAREGRRVAVLERGTVAGGASGYMTAKGSALQQSMLSQIRAVHGVRGTSVFAAVMLDALYWREEV